jgi:hypothetical protein
MEVLILSGNMAQDLNGNVYQIEGIEIIRVREQKNIRVFYNTGEDFYKAVAVPGLKINAYIIPGSRKIMLL